MDRALARRNEEKARRNEEKKCMADGVKFFMLLLQSTVVIRAYLKNGYEQIEKAPFSSTASIGGKRGKKPKGTELPLGDLPRIPQVRWSYDMDRVLINLLVDEANMGGKNPHNSWKPEALKRAVIDLNLQFPRVLPQLPLTPLNLRARLKTLKTQYAIAKELLSLSGQPFEWNADDKMVIATNEVWEEYLQAHPAAAILRNKPVHFYDELSIICGNEGAEGFAQHDGYGFSHPTHSRKNHVSIVLDDDEPPSPLDGINNGEQASSSLQPTLKTPTSAKRNRKNSDLQELTEAMKGVAKAATVMSNAYNVMAETYVLPNFVELSASLLAMGDLLTAVDVVKLLQLFEDNHDMVKIWYSVPEELKLTWLKMKLGNL